MQPEGSLTTFQLVNAGIHFSLALVWAIVAHNAWRFLRTRRPQSRFFRMLPVVTGTVSLAYCVFTLIALIPVPVRHSGSFGIRLIWAFNDATIFVVVALARHMARFFATPEASPPPRPWLAINYGSSVLMTGFALLFLGLLSVPRMPLPTRAYPVTRLLYQIVMLGAIIRQLMRIARPGFWRAGGAAWIARRADIVVLVGALVSLGSWFVLAVTTNWVSEVSIWEEERPWGVALDTIAGIGWAIPLAVRILGDVVRTFLVTTGMIAMTVALYFGARPLVASWLAPDLSPLVDLVSVLGMVLALLPAHSWLRSTVDQLVFRRSRRRRLALQASLQTLSPELGTVGLCRRTLEELVAATEMRGAAILLHTGELVVHGNVAADLLPQVWLPIAAAGAPTHALGAFELRELPADLAESLNDAGVSGVVPIISPRRRWGHLFISTGMLRAAFSEEEVQGAEALGGQLALSLDGAELLARAVAVERALAHSEKLAAIGELAARVAHEIRNPVTAARSLAQQLTRDPTSPLNPEHARLILTELERVERQVAALLRFARREEFRFEPVDLGELVQATVGQLRAQLEANGIDTDVASAAGLTVRADRDKTRQVLINLLENAVEALAGTAPPRRLAVAVTKTNGTASVSVVDNGAAVPVEALPRLFEPFFSLKAHGTGLGLAIAKRTVEAQGGRIEATRAEAAGMTFRIDLPLLPSQ